MKVSSLNWHFKDNNKDKTLVFFHGFMGKGEDFSPIADIIGDRFNYIFLDLPGHGKNSNQRILKEDFYSLLIEEIKSLKGRVSLVGYSMGGRILLENLKALESLDSIEEIVIESAHYGLESEEEKEEREKIDSKLLKEVDSLKTFLRSWYENLLFGKINQLQYFETLLEEKSKQSVNDLNYALNEFSLSKQKNGKKDLEWTSKKLGYIVGKEDEKYFHLSGQLKEGEMLKVFAIEGAAHNIHLEKPYLFARFLESFIVP